MPAPEWYHSAVISGAVIGSSSVSSFSPSGFSSSFLSSFSSSFSSSGGGGGGGGSAGGGGGGGGGGRGEIYALFRPGGSALAEAAVRGLKSAREPTLKRGRTDQWHQLHLAILRPHNLLHRLA